MTTGLQPPFEFRPVEEDLDEASPLGDYLADAESSFGELGSPFQSHDEDATITRRRRRPPRSISPIDSASHARRSSLVAPRRTSTSSLGDAPEAGPSRIPMETSRPVDTAFAERFKYLIASSGLLEKTQLDFSSTRFTDHTDSERSLSDVEPSGVAGGANTVPSVVVSQHDTDDNARQWDVLTTVGVLVAGLACVLGPTMMVPTTAIAAGLAYLHPASPKDEDDDYEDASLTPEAQERDTPESTYASLPSSPEVDTFEDAKEETSASDRVFASLESLLAESRSLDQTITSSLQILAPHPDDPSHAHELRVALNRLLDDMTDSFAACTSTLIPMADRSELAVLGEMYDIPVLGPRRPLRRCSSESQETDTSRRRSLSSSHVAPLDSIPLSPLDPDDKFTKLPDRTVRQRRSGYSGDWTLSSPTPVYRAVQEPIPENNHEGTLSDSLSSASSSVPATIPAEPPSPLASRNRPQPFVPKRASPLAQALERLEGATPLPISPPRAAVSGEGKAGYRRSLQDIRYIHSSPPSTSEAAANLALARASANLSSANRRSLQLPGDSQAAEALEQAILAAGANLHRARSLPQRPGLRPIVSASSPSSKRSSVVSNQSTQSAVKRLSALSALSDLQLAASESTPSSKRTSLLYPDNVRSSGDFLPVGIGLAPHQFARPRFSRIASVSPLTLGGLKASYLGVHLKRRRVACCLLGLRFCVRGEEDEAYWSSVSEALRILSNIMAMARQRLEMVRLEAEKEAAAARALSGLSPISPVTRCIPGGMPLFSQPPADFAPRDTTEQALLANVDELQRTLARVWARCDEMRSRVTSGDADSLADTWSEVRTDIGGLLRHVERGRNLTRRDDEGESVFDQDETESSTPPMPMPEFLRRWADPGPAELERSAEDDFEDADEALPLPGIDEVFEAEIPPAPPRARSTMSREERIALTREARAKGMSLAQLMASPQEAEQERQRALTADRMRAESEMISELEGVFGAIRKRKGME